MPLSGMEDFGWERCAIVKCVHLPVHNETGSQVITSDAMQAGTMQLSTGVGDQIAALQCDSG